MGHEPAKKQVVVVKSYVLLSICFFVGLVGLVMKCVVIRSNNLIVISNVVLI